MEELVTELLDELTIELGVTKESDVAILEVKLKNAIREVISAVGFRPSHDEAFRMNEIRNYIGNIKDLAMYDYSIVGAEGNTSYEENGIGRSWKKRTDCFNGIVRYADI